MDNSELDVFLTSQTYSAPITHFSDYAVKTGSGLIADVVVTYPTSIPVGMQGYDHAQLHWICVLGLLQLEPYGNGHSV